MELPKIIIHHKNSLDSLCEKYGIDKLYLFGSLSTEGFNEESDMDLLVELSEKDPVKKGLALMGFWDDTEKLFKRKVDLLTQTKIKNPYLNKSIEATKQLVYERKEF